MENQSQDLKAWLESVNCYDVKPVAVRIGRKTFTAAFYKQDRKPLPGARSQDDYTIEALYCVGKRARQDTCAYMIDGRLWYLAGYCDEVSAHAADLHFSDSNFILMPCPEGDKPWSVYQELMNREHVEVQVIEEAVQ